MNVYGHVTERMQQQQATDALDRVLGRKKASALTPARAASEHLGSKSCLHLR
jgi:hypothetical protein